MSLSSLDYVVIIPAKNEEQYLSDCLESLINQTQSPKKIVVVNDNSDDETFIIASNFSKQHSIVKVINSNSTEISKQQGGAVINAFNMGIEYIKNQSLSYDVICKNDADIIFPENYYEKVLNAFEKDDKLGICGGQCLISVNGIWKVEPSANYHVRGALKAIRTSCFNEIDGFKPVLGWDGLDEMTAMFHGWTVQVIDVYVKHLRHSSADHNPLKIAFKIGRTMYKNGSTFFLISIRTLYRIKKAPYFLYAMSFFLGYNYAFIRKEPRNVSLELKHFINKYHKKRLLISIRKKLSLK